MLVLSDRLVIDFKGIQFLFEVVIFNHYLSLFVFNLILCNDWSDGGTLPITVEWSKLLDIRLLYFLRYLLRTSKLETVVAVFFILIVLAGINFFFKLMWAFCFSCPFFPVKCTIKVLAFVTFLFLKVVWWRGKGWGRLLKSSLVSSILFFASWL